ncbi:HypC/HybG/HupF family hydrogenase formation chaperone [Hyphococcus luteus]|uniref:Hydrogenase maturation factor HypC n=1 Tax=Hyphococcus luteus TaxID=2058213 RepID=A0A2S7K0E6_9PROT|nr:HypC/HybG/HupF family hydrogenase formation chaperone [Marinicaulis flavus]PQA85974.1 HypC/HybG/HupF family hydrogenase formation chaperone [Marinicaulis flavus]
MCLAIPGRVLDISGAAYSRSARVDFGGVIKEASLALAPEVQIGDYVIVHAGVAITRLDEEAAQRTLDEIANLTALDQAPD